jgi:hypothetical protein
VGGGSCSGSIGGKCEEGGLPFASADAILLLLAASANSGVRARDAILLDKVREAVGLKPLEHVAVSARL